MKVNFRMILVADFDEAISPSYFDEFLKSKLGDSGLELVLPYGGGDYVLIVKDKISDK